MSTPIQTISAVSDGHEKSNGLNNKQEIKTEHRLCSNTIDEIVESMTVEEKAHLVVGTGMAGFDAIVPSLKAVDGSPKNIVAGAAGMTWPVERLGIPSIVLADGPAGLRIDPTREGDTNTYYCTHFPIETLLGCTWNTELVEQVGNAMGNETLEYGIDILLAPAMNIMRNPLCGRNFEYYSEDPVVSGKMAAASVTGIQANGVGASVKHLAVNNQETNRMGNDAQVSQRALREIYLKGFDMAIHDSKPWTVMSSYNRINGVYTSESTELLQTLLRDEWGFEGAIMSDWFAGTNPVQQMIAGNDLLMPGTQVQYDAIVKAVSDGALDEKILDRNVKKILELIVRTPRFRNYRFSNKPDLKAHAEIARRSATEGMVLLKNDGETLPLRDSVRKIALYGCTSYDWIAGGTGSGNVNSAYTVSLSDGLKDAGYTIVDPNLSKRYIRHIEEEYKRDEPRGGYNPLLVKPRPAEMAIAKVQIANDADKADIAIVTIGRNSGEFVDRNESDFELTEAERTLLEDVSEVFHSKGKKVVVVLNIGGVIETASWTSLADAVLCAWQGGQEGGASVADILSGKVNPSGKLTMTFPIKLADIPSTANFPIDFNEGLKFGDSDSDPVKKRNYHFTQYLEDIYVGYRYFDTFNKPVSFPFGFGLSYTSFEYSDSAVTKEGDLYKVTVKVSNTGVRPGKEVVQLYISAPNYNKSNKPVKELKAFAKTQELRPGESCIVEMSFKGSDLASFDAEKSEWVVTPGRYELLIGASSRDIRQKLETEIPEWSKRVDNILAPMEELDLLSHK